MSTETGPKQVAEETTAGLAAEACSAGYSPADEWERAVLDLWVNLLQTTNVVRALISEKLGSELGVSPEEVELLMRLSVAPDNRLRMVEVSNLMLVSKSGVTRLVDKLEERGLVKRALCPTDRRVVYTEITERGLETLREAAPLLVAGLVEYLGRHLERRQVEKMSAGLHGVLVENGAREPNVAEAVLSG